MSTTVAMPGGRRLRTVEHLLAALHACGVDNVLIEVSSRDTRGGEVPIADGSALAWLRLIGQAGLVRLPAPRRVLRVVKPVQVERDGGFLRAEPADHFSVDVTHDLLPRLPVMRWAGRIDPASFAREIAPARSFGNLHRRLGLTPAPRARPEGAPSQMRHRPDPACACSTHAWEAMQLREMLAETDAPLLRGWRPWRTAVVWNEHILPWPRFPDEPVRHAVLDMIGDLALAGAPVLGRFVAHNPSHDKTFALAFALIDEPAACEFIELREEDGERLKAFVPVSL